MLSSQLASCTWVCHASINEVEATQWNALCTAQYPFIRHEFLRALELSASVCANTGWLPKHLAIYAGDHLVAALPLYIKSHSYGEYVFDWSWAEAYQRHGLAYYPKLLTAIPFTPCWGPRLLVAQGLDENAQKTIVKLVWQAVEKIVQDTGASGWHGLFWPERERDFCAEQNVQRNSSVQFAERLGTQFHWFNRGYKTWDDFVAQLSSRKRKLLTKERRQVIEQGFHFVQKTGADLTEHDWEMFYQFYRNTYFKRSGHKGYLTRQFFLQLHKNFSAHTLMVLAEREGKTWAASLYFYDNETLYGRYWGCEQEFPLLHFETCYYQGIDFAIAKGLKRFDGGAQGEHKIQRGFEPITTHSFHWLMQPEFQRAINHFVLQEAESIAEYQQAVREHLPFKHSEQ